MVEITGGCLGCIIGGVTVDGASPSPNGRSRVQPALFARGLGFSF